MKTQKSKKYQIGIYVTLAISLLALGGLAFVTAKTRADVSHLYKMWALLAAYALFLFFFFSKALKIPEIWISKDGISVISGNNKKRIKWKDISDVDYYGRDKVLNRETILIKTKNSSKPVSIYYSRYSNANEIVEAIKSCRTAYQNGETSNLKVVELPKSNAVSESRLSSGNFEYVSRLPLFSVQTYLALFLIFMSIDGIFKQIPVKGANQIIAIIMLLIIFILSSLIGVLGIFKVGISNQYLMIKHFYFPYRKGYRIEDIKEVIIERPLKNNPQTGWMKGMRIIFTDESRKVRVITNFYNGDWNKLEMLLRKKKIPVQNNLRSNS